MAAVLFYYSHKGRAGAFERWAETEPRPARIAGKGRRTLVLSVVFPKLENDLKPTVLGLRNTAGSKARKIGINIPV